MLVSLAGQAMYAALVTDAACWTCAGRWLRTWRRPPRIGRFWAIDQDVKTGREEIEETAAHE
jgi:hypothetical protein